LRFLLDESVDFGELISRRRLPHAVIIRGANTHADVPIPPAVVAETISLRLTVSPASSGQTARH
jgi:hypothetical protein